ncbi:MAG: response regulator transcription factor [Paludibacteraceae bacterium]|nr:response regulator transcription factor [Bacteroidales bacterium]MBO5133293.1 response regulator transcription factor [Paludibacteraceae bacterium]MBQ9101012.1 response regulator transcription factor [Paludibacteraceae bacterium]
MATKIKILLIENSPILIEGTSNILRSLGNIEISKVVPNCDKALTLLTGYAPSIIIADTRLVGYQTAQFINTCKEKNTSIAIVALQTNFISQEQLDLFDGTISIEDNIQSIQSKLKTVLSPETEKEGNDNFDLSIREKEVLVAVAKGKTNKEIADELNISIHTVMTHRKNITGKTGIKSISGLTVYALINNLVKQEEVN